MTFLLKLMSIVRLYLFIFLVDFLFVNASCSLGQKMPGGKSVWLIVVLIALEGCSCSNSTQKANATLGTTVSNEQTSVEETTTRETEIPTTSQNPVLNEKFPLNSTNLNQTNLEVLKIFHEQQNITNTTTEQVILVTTSTKDFLSVNFTNGTSPKEANYTVTGAVASSEDVLPFRLPNWAAIVAGVCLVSAVIGYISCVSYRRFLQRKYGNVQMVIGEDVYDTSDLRNFEI